MSMIGSTGSPARGATVRAARKLRRETMVIQNIRPPIRSEVDRGRTGGVGGHQSRRGQRSDASIGGRRLDRHIEPESTERLPEPVMSENQICLRLLGLPLALKPT